MGGRGYADGDILHPLRVGPAVGRQRGCHFAHSLPEHNEGLGEAVFGRWSRAIGWAHYGPTTPLEATMPTPSSVEFFFDPTCPWTWMTSRWLVEATGAKGVAVEWRSLSLGVLNAGREIPEQYRAPMEAAKRVHRVMAALRAAERNDLVDALYTEWGRRTFHDGATPSLELVHEVVEAVGATGWSPAIDDDTLDAAVEGSTAEALDLAGPDIGSPVIAFGSPKVGVFGPIVSPPPTGAAAGELFDHVVAFASMAGVYEVKRGRNAGPAFGPRP